MVVTLVSSGLHSWVTGVQSTALSYYLFDL